MIKINLNTRTCLFVCILLLCGVSVQGSPTKLNAFPASPARWLAVAGTTGKVFITLAGQDTHLARRGDRLQSFGDRLRTEQGASAVLYFDDGIGVLDVSQVTTVTVVRLAIGAGNSARTRLKVVGGQIKFTIRKFTNPGSRLEIVTPAGTAAVRGTRFGVAVNGKGLTAVATEDGRVIASAQGQSTSVSGGYQSLIVPGEPPAAIEALPEYARLYAMRFDPAGPGQIKLSARTDPGNLVQVVNAFVDTDPKGRFSIVLDLPADRLIPVQVATPLGNAQLFNLTVLPEQVALTQTPLEEVLLPIKTELPLPGR